MGRHFPAPFVAYSCLPALRPARLTSLTSRFLHSLPPSVRSVFRLSRSSLGPVVPTAMSGNEWRRNDTVSEESERKDDRNRRVETEDSFCFLVVSFPFPLRSLSTRHSAPRFVPLLGASLLVMNGKRYEKRSDREEREMS